MKTILISYVLLAVSLVLSSAYPQNDGHRFHLDTLNGNKDGFSVHGSYDLYKGDSATFSVNGGANVYKGHVVGNQIGAQLTIPFG